MLTNDNSYDMINRKVDSVKKSIALQTDNQKQKESGHGSADYGSGPSQSAAVPSGSPGTGGSSGRMSY